MTHYEMDGSVYLLKDENGRTIYGCDEIAIGYSDDGHDAILHKHGSKELVEKWAIQTRNAYLKHGIEDLAMEIKVFSGIIPVDKLNRILDTTGYLGIYLKEIGLR